MAKDISSLYPGRKDFERGANLLKKVLRKNASFSQQVSLVKRLIHLNELEYCQMVG